MIKNTETITMEVLGLETGNLEEIRALPHVYEATWQDNRLRVAFSGGKHNLIRVMDYFKEHEISFGRVYTELPTLNDVFLEITGKELRD